MAPSFSSQFAELLARRPARMAAPGGLEPGNEPPDATAIFPGAFNPLHAGHLQMRQIASRMLGQPVALELSVTNVDKGPLDEQTVTRRLAGLASLPLWLTNAPTFVEKATLFPGAVFVVGIDTLTRIADPRYYAAAESERDAAIGSIAQAGCSLLVFGRQVDGQFRHVEDFALPSGLTEICRAVPESDFRLDVSSTHLRQQH